jgi:hypothetical protein
MEQQSHSKTTTNTTHHQPVDKTTKIKPVHALGLLALNPGPIEKNNNKEVLPQPLRQKKVAMMRTFPIMAPEHEAISAFASTGQHSPGDTVMSSMACSYSSVLSTPSVAGSVEFTETHPEALHGLDIDKDAPASEQQAPSDTAMLKTANKSLMTHEIMYKTMTKFFHHVNNIGFTSADGNTWWLVYNFYQIIFTVYRDIAHTIFFKLLSGPYAGEIEKLTKYIKNKSATELLDQGGRSRTPVMTFNGLQTMLDRLSKMYIYHVDANVCDMANKAILLFNPRNETPSEPIQEPASGGVSGTMSNFFHDANNIGFTSADGEPWYLVHNYNEKELKLDRNYSRRLLSGVLQGRSNGEEIEQYMKYITWYGDTKELFDKGGPRMTPVMTITGLQKMLNGMKKYLRAKVFEIAENNILLFNPGNAAPSAPIQEPASGGASMSTSHMEVLNMCVWDVLLYV